MLDLQQSLVFAATVLCLNDVVRTDWTRHFPRLFFSFLFYLIDPNRCIQGIVCSLNFIGAAILTKYFCNRYRVQTRAYIRMISTLSIIMIILMTIFINLYLPKLDLMNRLPLFWIFGIISVFATFNLNWDVGIRIFGFNLSYSTMAMWGIMMVSKYFADTKPAAILPNLQ